MILPYGEYRMFDKPDYAAGRPGDAAWYKERAVSDHINEPGHRQRLLQAVELIKEYLPFTEDETVSDFGAGNGGLLHELKERKIKSWGYDLSPLAVEWGRSKYKVCLNIADVTTCPVLVRCGDIVVLTEFLEHLVDPHALLGGIYKKELGRGKQVEFIVASVPGFEDPRAPYEYHLWCWHGAAFADVFSRIGWKVRKHFFRADCTTQFLVASR